MTTVHIMRGQNHWNLLRADTILHVLCLWCGLTLITNGLLMERGGIHPTRLELPVQHLVNCPSIMPLVGRSSHYFSLMVVPLSYLFFSMNTYALHYMLYVFLVPYGHFTLYSTLFMFSLIDIWSFRASS